MRFRLVKNILGDPEVMLCHKSRRPSGQTWTSSHKVSYPSSEGSACSSLPRGAPAIGNAKYFMVDVSCTIAIVFVKKTRTTEVRKNAFI
jgi:hypothetical protein